MDWQKFVAYFEKKHNEPVLTPLLRQSKLTKINDDECIIECESNGAKSYLDGKRSIIESVLHDFIDKTPTLNIVVQQQKKRVSSKKKEREDSEISIMDYQGDQEKKKRRSGLQDRFTFENFAVSNTNEMAHAAAQAVSRNPGNMYNPLFIYGSVGVGKTHLSQAVGNSVLEDDLTKKVLYCTSEEFTNDLVETIRKKNTKPMREKYRKLDVLIVDDAQFIAGKNYVQEEFYHTFNSIVNNGGQIVLTSDRPPREIKALEDRLRSRFNGGLIIDMQSPDFELRTAIVLIKAEERNIEIDMQAAQNIAQRIKDSRELEGALLKLLSYTLAKNEDNKITAETAQSELQRRAEEKVKRIKPKDIIKGVANYYELKPSHIKGRSRKQNIALARQVVMYLMRKKLSLNLEEIAFMVKRKDHTTISHGVDKIESAIMKDEELKEDIQTIYDTILQI